mgnify:FL=1
MISDFRCTFDNAIGISPEITKDLKLSFPDAYMHADTMAKIAHAMKQKEGAAFCMLPFCHTVEAEAMGGIVNMGDGKFGPRAKEYCCTSAAELLELPAIDYSKGRIHEVLEACQILREQGEHVALMISGPFTIFNVLIDPKYVFKAMRKQPELMRDVFQKIEKELLRFIKVAISYGADMISYADSSGGVNILGPKMAEQVVKDFTYDFLKKAAELVDGKAMLLLCPKTTLALIGMEKACYVDHELPEVLRYGDACIAMIGQVPVAGQMCIKNISYRLENKNLREIKLY